MEARQPRFGYKKKVPKSLQPWFHAPALLLHISERIWITKKQVPPKDLGRPKT